MRRILPLLALAVFGAGAAVAAEYSPRRPRPLGEPADEARVIVQFKADAKVMSRMSLAPGARHLLNEHLALEQRAAQLAARAGLPLAARGGVSDRSQVVSARGLSSAALAARLARDPEVEFAVADERMRATRVPNDPLYLTGGAAGPALGQWYLRPPSSAIRAAINAEQAWDQTLGDASVIVAVLDSGVRSDHPDLAGKLLSGYDFISDATVANDGDGRDADASDPGDWVTAAEAGQAPFTNCDEADSSWHGTMVSGLIAAATDNGTGMAGTGWNVRVLPVRVLGKCFGHSSDIIAGMRWAAGLPVPGVPDNRTPAKVLNLSLGSQQTCTSAYQTAVNEIVGQNKIIVAAAGNSAGHAVGQPANCNGVIGVTALRHIGTKVGFADLGPEIAIAAPGGNCVELTAEACQFPLLTTANDGLTVPGNSVYTDSSRMSVGTSFSSPLVAGTLALMASVRPSITPPEARNLLKASARAFPFRGAPDDEAGVVPACAAPTATDQLQCYCTTGLCGAGMLDAQAAVAGALGLVPRITVDPAAPQAGQTITLSSAQSELPAGRVVVAYSWSLVDDGDIVSGVSSATDAAIATVVPSAAGRFTMRLTITDDSGLTSSAETTVTVAAAPAPPADSGGGGAMGVPWLVALALAGVLTRRRRRPA